jgi:transcriptional regulator EpsA
MSFNNDFTDDERDLLLDLINESLHVKTHIELFTWLQGKLQLFIPHEVLISAWGDFSLGLIYFDILSAVPGLRTNSFTQKDLTPLLKTLFHHWHHNQAPLILNNTYGFFQSIKLEHDDICQPLDNMRSAVVHGINDTRGHHDTLYILMSSDNIPVASSKIFTVLLPYIDFAIRRIDHTPAKSIETTAIVKNEPLATTLQAKTNDILSDREKNIMQWVRAGKTNAEIGLILDISAFTVKNHLQRIFKKLNVFNRAQAVAICNTKDL